LEQVDRLALDEGHDRPLGVGTGAPGERLPVALALAGAVEGVHLGDLDVEDALHGVADLGLGGRGVDLEGVDPGLHEGVGLLAHHRSDDDVTGVLHLSSLPSSSASVSLSASPDSASAASASAALAAFVALEARGALAGLTSASASLSTSASAALPSGSASAS